MHLNLNFIIYVIFIIFVDILSSYTINFGDVSSQIHHF